MKYTVFVVTSDDDEEAPDYLENQFDWLNDSEAKLGTVKEIQDLTKVIMDGSSRLDITKIVKFVLLFREEEVIPISFFSPESPNSLIETPLDDAKRAVFQKKLQRCLH